MIRFLRSKLRGAGSSAFGCRRAAGYVALLPFIIEKI
jgi:hypothetical protein